MPIAPPTCCTTPGCGGLRRQGVCDRCGPKKRKAHDRTTTERGYGADWQRFRKQRQAEQPLCADCLEQGIVSPAVEFHHRNKIKHRPDLRLDEANVVGLCGPCHDKRTARGE